jgi:hypothetical protein
MSGSGEPSALLLAGGLLKVEPLTDEVDNTSIASTSTSSSAPITPPSGTKKEKKSSSKLSIDDSSNAHGNKTRERSASGEVSDATLEASLKFVDDQLSAVRKRLVAV